MQVSMPPLHNLHPVPNPPQISAESRAGLHALAAMAMRLVVEVEPRGRSDGLVAAVVVLPDGRNVSAELVYAGLAWVDPRHCTRKICDFWREGEEAARNARKGLWSRGDAVPPWEWRRKAE